MNILKKSITYRLVSARKRLLFASGTIGQTPELILAKWRNDFWPNGCPLPVCAEIHASRSLPLSAAIDLHEIHLAPQPSLQVPVGHIPVPGGIKLCSPGTFWIANYLIINNGSCRVNFTKPNMATIRYTNSQWLREDATEALVGKVAVPKTGQKPPFATRGCL